MNRMTNFIDAYYRFGHLVGTQNLGKFDALHIQRVTEYRTHTLYWLYESVQKSENNRWLKWLEIVKSNINNFALPKPSH